MPETPEKNAETFDDMRSKRPPTQFVTRLTLPAQSRAKSRRHKGETSTETTQIVPEARLREQAAWKQVEETGRPVQFEDKLLIPDGMSIWEAIEFLPDSVREQVRSAMQEKIGDVYAGLVQQQRTEILKMGTEDSKWAAYQTFPYAAQLAIADSIVRQQLGFPETPLRELIELYGGKIADASENERSE